MNVSVDGYGLGVGTALQAKKHAITTASWYVPACWAELLPSAAAVTVAVAVAAAIGLEPAQHMPPTYMRVHHTTQFTFLSISLFCKHSLPPCDLLAGRPNLTHKAFLELVDHTHEANK